MNIDCISHLAFFSYFAVDCKWNPFGEWTECSNPCGPGTQERTRTARIKAQFGGRQCTGPTTETRACKIEDCPRMHESQPMFLICTFIFKITQ